MSISANIHSTDTTLQNCIVTIRDNDELVCDYVNVGLTLNLDGTANTAYIKESIKRIVLDFRYRTNTVTINTS